MSTSWEGTYLNSERHLGLDQGLDSDVKTAATHGTGLAGVRNGDENGSGEADGALAVQSSNGHTSPSIASQSLATDMGEDVGGGGIGKSFGMTPPENPVPSTSGHGRERERGREVRIAKAVPLSNVSLNMG